MKTKINRYPKLAPVQHLTGFVTEFNHAKCEYDSGFRPWGKV